MRRGAAVAVLAGLVLGCTSTPVRQSGPALRLPSSDRLGLLGCSAAPGYPETGEIADRILAARRPEARRVDAATRDREALGELADREGLGALLWCSVDQYTPYSWTNRLWPATPPYTEISLFLFRRDTGAIQRSTAHKQGALPATIKSRQPTFEDVAAPVLTALLDGA